MCPGRFRFGAARIARREPGRCALRRRRCLTTSVVDLRDLVRRPQSRRGRVDDELARPAGMPLRCPCARSFSRAVRRKPIRTLRPSPRPGHSVQLVEVGVRALVVIRRYPRRMRQTGRKLERRSLPHSVGAAMRAGADGRRFLDGTLGACPSPYVKASAGVLSTTHRQSSKTGQVGQDRRRTGGCRRVQQSRAERRTAFDRSRL